MATPTIPAGSTSTPTGIEYSNQQHRQDFIAALKRISKAGEEMRKASSELEKLLSQDEKKKIGEPNTYIYAEEDNPRAVWGLFRFKDRYQVEGGGDRTVLKELVRQALAGTPYRPPM